MPVHHELISVQEAASRLNVHPSRVRAMAQARQLDAEKVADRWLIDPSSLQRRAESVVAQGRPYSPANAWALLCLAEGEPVDWVSPSALSRLRSKLRSRGLLDLAPRLRARADVMRLRAHPSALPRIGEEPDVVKAGISAARDAGLNIQASEELEAYISRSRLNNILKKYHLAESDQPNVLLRVVDDDESFPWQRCIGPAVVAIDLFESHDPRSRRAARQFLNCFEIALQDSQ